MLSIVELQLGIRGLAAELAVVMADRPWPLKLREDEPDLRGAFAPNSQFRQRALAADACIRGREVAPLLGRCRQRRVHSYSGVAEEAKRCGVTTGGA